jgi:hypothetical protein
MEVMKKINVSYLPRTKHLDDSINSIQKRMNSFKAMHGDELFASEPDVTIDYNIAGKPWIRVLAEDEFAHFEAGSYRISPDKEANILVRYDIIANKIKDIIASVEE